MGENKRLRIVEGALRTFLTYGFARTTMDDIAQAAGLSRPALYLEFRNKADIFRAVGQDLLEQSSAKAKEALRGSGSLRERILAALDAAVFDLMDEINASPHGVELVDMENRIASDIVSGWRDVLVEAFTHEFASAARREGVVLAERGLTAASLAEMLLDMLEGMRMRGECGPGAREAADRMLLLAETAIECARDARMTEAAG
ncbi:TetR/AcrR family transcriptional regulator [Nitratireductor basaltis]|uniref:Transcriptional regulator, TetR family n=1 Tax=Nitratireductor basaltis TaxID=472175 RepID=A0A084U713_9HYPH|nr:TetR/AcrR family transcriptional regulator [Nitratireductor basaltis]KFB08749.1 Transcriptional regulator, TetR family [Nitratireductor basaltis]